MVCTLLQLCTEGIYSVPTTARTLRGPVSHRAGARGNNRDCEVRHGCGGGRVGRVGVEYMYTKKRGEHRVQSIYSNRVHIY